MAGISLDDARAQSGNNAPVEPTSPSPTRGLTLEAARLGGDPLSAENVRPSLRSVVFHDDPLGEMGKGLKKGVGMAGQLADMALGLPGQAIRVGANIGGRLSALTQGASAEDAAWAGKAMADQVPRSLTNPVGTAMEALGYGKDYNENQVAHVLESVMGVVSKGGEWVEEATGKTLLKRDVEDLFETFMLSLGARGTAVGLDPKLKKLARPEVGDVPRAAGNLERYRGKPPPGGWRRPLEEPTMDEPGRVYGIGEGVDLPEVRSTPDGRPSPFVFADRTGPAVWATPRARSPVGEAVDLTNEPRVPAGEATEVPHIPTGEAVELPAEGIPLGEARQIGGAVGAKIADRMTAEREAAVFADAKRLAPETYKELKAKGLLPAVAGAGAAYAAMQALSDDDRDAVLAAVGGGFRPKPKQTLAQFSKTLAGSIREQVARTKLAVEQAAKTGQYQWDAGDVVYSPKTGRVMTILGRTITKKGEPRYFYEAGKEGEDGWSRGELIADKAHESLTLIAQAEKPDGGKLLSAAAAGTGLGLVLTYPEDAGEIAAIAAGGVLAGKGKSRGMEYLKNIPDKAPLGAVLEPSATTLLTLERLDPKRFEFPKAMIEQELRRPDVTKAEKELFAWALGNISGDSVTAKQLVTMLKMKMGDWELARAETNRWADYGLEGIDRISDEARNYDENGRALPGEPDLTPATTTLYNLPEELGVQAGNHFGVPNNFAHTRSFVEDGVRYVVEIQSDLVQKMRVLEEGEKTKLQTELAKVAREIVEAQNHNRGILTEDGSAYRQGRSAADRRLLQPLELREAEIQAALRASDQAVHNRPLIEPLIKDWYKRVVREELARGARDRAARLKSDADLEADIAMYQKEVTAGNPEFIGANDYIDSLIRQRGSWEGKRDVPVPAETVRFATADTVAKVEGWPRAADARDVANARRMVEAAEANVAEVERSGQGPVFRPSPEHARALARAEKELAGFRERLADYEEQLASGRQFAWKEHQSIYDRYRGDIEKFLRRLGGRPYTDSAGHTWFEVPTSGSKGLPAGKRVQQFGGINPELAAGLAAATISSAAVAWLSPLENRTKNAALAAAIVGLTAWGRSRSPAIRERVAEVFSGAEKVAGVLSTTLSNISPAITKRLRDHARHELQATNEALNTIGPFVRELRRLPEAVAERLNAALLTGDPRAIREAIIAAGSRVIQQEYERAIRPLLDQVGRDLHATGRLRQLKLGMGMEYYPRIVTDLKGLLEALGREEGSVLQRMLDQAEHNAERRTNMPLSDLERTLVIGQYLKARNTGAGRPGFLKPRTVGEVTPDLARFYAPASESLPIYLRSVMKEIERARFFGEDLVRESGTGVTNLEASIGNVVEGERARGNITDAQIETLRELLRSRFGPGEKAMSGNLQLVRNLTNVGLLGNITSSVTQAGDILLAYYAHGLVPTIKGASKVLTRDAKRATVRDLGLVDHITEEVTGGARTPLIVMGREITSAKFVEKTFKMSGFSAVDQLGKAVSINAALVKYQEWAKSPAVIARIREKYGRAYGDDFDGLVRDLRAGEMTENVRSLLFSELSDLQPISKLEVPKAYLDNPNGRIIYQLRTYTIKMMDIARRDGFQEIARGNVSRGVGNLLRLAIVLGISGATTGFVVNWMLGKTNKLDWGDIPENALKTMGWSSFVLDKARKGEPISAIAGAVAPPWQMWDRILRQDPAAVQYLPPLGKIYYYHELGGKERANAWAEKQDRLSNMSDAEYAEMLRRREERKRTEESRR